MKKFACILTALTLFGAVTPARHSIFSRIAVALWWVSIPMQPLPGGAARDMPSLPDWLILDMPTPAGGEVRAPLMPWRLAPKLTLPSPPVGLSNCVATCPTAKWSFAELACAECRAKLTKRSEIGDERMGSPCDRMRSELFGDCRESARADAAVAEARSKSLQQSRTPRTSG